MFVEQFVTDPARVAQLREAIALLHNSGAVQVFFEIAKNRSKPQPSDDIISTAALCASFHEGYTECLMDVLDFPKRFLQAVTPMRSPTPDWGAGKALVGAGEISAEEYDNHKRSSIPKSA